MLSYLEESIGYLKPGDHCGGTPEVGNKPVERQAPAAPRHEENVHKADVPASPTLWNSVRDSGTDAEGARKANVEHEAPPGQTGTLGPLIAAVSDGVEGHEPDRLLVKGTVLFATLEECGDEVASVRVRIRSARY
ncbi:hypothetical protein CCMA1212_001557 [Trichoderma ghanense]|uniref:Uncharacterized protein n=1 Tax=Trichoderma ghanense TaxID=65468 RepID=A0ABY2HC63_9HYPO